jgi:hypothetical protein
MARLLRFLYRLCCAGLLGAQVFFAAGAAPVVFSPAVAALPRDDARRQAAADLVGAMLSRLDGAALALTALAVLCALLLGARRAAIPPLLAGLCAAASAAWATPSIHALRLAGETASRQFGIMHGVSSGLLLMEIFLLAVATFLSPGSAQAHGPGQAPAASP